MFNHQLKKRVFDKAQKCYRDVVVHTNARLGSDIRDCHDHQIFEGDTVCYDGKIFTVEFERGAFRIGDLLLNSCAEDADFALSIVKWSSPL